MPIPPDNRSAGDDGHIQDHNDISDELTSLSAAISAASSAVAAEATRAEGAEGLALAKSQNLSDLASATEARTNLGLGTAATSASSAFDAAGAAGVAQSNAETFATAAVATETGRAEEAEALALALAGGTLTGWLAPAVAALTDGSSVAIDVSQGNVFDWPLGASSHTLATPSNPVNGQTFRVRIAYSGAFTPLFSSAYDFGADGQPTWTATSGKVDQVGWEYDANISKWCCLGWKLGF